MKWNGCSKPSSPTKMAGGMGIGLNPQCHQHHRGRARVRLTIRNSDRGTGRGLLASLLAALDGQRHTGALEDSGDFADDSQRARSTWWTMAGRSRFAAMAAGGKDYRVHSSDRPDLPSPADPREVACWWTSAWGGVDRPGTAGQTDWAPAAAIGFITGRRRCPWR